MLPGLRTLFSTEAFMARGHSYLWTPSLLIMELATNAVIAAAHALDVWVIWLPLYGVDVVVRCATAVTAVAAAIVLPRILRKS